MLISCVSWPPGFGLAAHIAGMRRLRQLKRMTGDNLEQTARACASRFITEFLWSGGGDGWIASPPATLVRIRLKRCYSVFCAGPEQRGWLVSGR